MNELQHFINRLWADVSPVLAIIWACLCWVMFPDVAYYPAAISVAIALTLDIATKLFALAKKNGGYYKAIKNKIILSDTLWRKTNIKLVAYMVIMILAGLSARVTPLAQLGVFVATVVYAFIFVRECQSNVENLIEAGADGLKPLLFWLKKKEKNIIEENENMEG